MSKYEPEQVDEMRAHRDSIIRIYYDDVGVNESPVDIGKDGVNVFPQDYPIMGGRIILDEDQVNVLMSSKHFDRELFEMLIKILDFNAGDALMVSLS